MNKNTLIALVIVLGIAVMLMTYPIDTPTPPAPPEIDDDEEEEEEEEKEEEDVLEPELEVLPPEYNPAGGLPGLVRVFDGAKEIQLAGGEEYNCVPQEVYFGDIYSSDINTLHSLKKERAYWDGPAMIVRRDYDNQEYVVYYNEDGELDYDYIEETILGTIPSRQSSLPGDLVSTRGLVGVRKLKDAYTGPLMKVRNDSDVDLDIGMDINGDLDLNALSSHCGGGNGRVMVWYTQDGTNNDFEPRSSANLSDIPRIYTAGEVERDRIGHIGVKFVGWGLQSNTGVVAGETRSFAIVRCENGSSTGYIVDFDLSSAAKGGGAYSRNGYSGRNSSQGNVNLNAPKAYFPYISYCSITSTTATVRNDYGSAFNQVSDNLVDGNKNLNLGAQAGGSNIPFDGWICELVYTDVDMESGSLYQDVIESINDYWKTNEYEVRVNSWFDQSGNSNTLYQPTANSQPYLYYQNSKWYPDFDRTKPNVIKIGDSISTGLTNIQRTYMDVSIPSNVNTDFSVYYLIEQDELELTGNTYTLLSLGLTNLSPSIAIKSGAYSTPGGDLGVQDEYRHILTRAFGQSSGRWVLRKDGSAIYDGSGSEQYLNKRDGITIGLFPTTSRYIDAFATFLATFNVEHSLEQMESIEGYINSRY